MHLLQMRHNFSTQCRSSNSLQQCNFRCCIYYNNNDNNNKMDQNILPDHGYTNVCNYY